MDLRLCGMDTGSLGPPVCAVWELSASAVQRASASSSGCSPHIVLMLLLFPGELPHAPHLKPRAVCSPQLSPIDRRAASPATSRAAISTVSMFLSASHFSVQTARHISGSGTCGLVPGGPPGQVQFGQCGHPETSTLLCQTTNQQYCKLWLVPFLN